jgi:SAM-dependent methyltransferase
MTWWWERFDAVIREWIRTDPASAATWAAHGPNNNYPALQAMANRGQIGKDAPIRAAVWEAMNYQRGHLDAFRSVIDAPLREWGARDEDRAVGIVDLGCGAGTVGFAFAETFNRRTTFHYVGYDHNKPSRQLCRKMLDPGVSPTGGTVTVKKDLVTAFDHGIDEFPKLDRLFVTSSYLLCQDTMTADQVREITAQIERLVVARGDVRIVISDASWSASLAHVLVDGLVNSAIVHVIRNDKDAHWYNLRFPGMTGTTWRQVIPNRKVDGHYLVARRAAPSH